MIYQSERLYFREFIETDFHLLYSLFSDKQVMEYTLLDFYTSEEALLPYFKDILLNNSSIINRKAYEYAVFSTVDNSFIGIADIIIDNKNAFGGIGEIGYITRPAFWGKGYATEMAKTLLEIGFKNIKLHRLYAKCNANNQASKRVMEKIGMLKEGEFRKVRFKDNRWMNEFVYSILAEEWE